MKKDGVSDELREIYRRAAADDIWIREWAGNLAAAGPMKLIEKLEKKTGRKIDIAKDIDLGDIVSCDLGLPGTGKTREEACRNAVAECKRHFRIK